MGSTSSRSSDATAPVAVAMDAPDLATLARTFTGSRRALAARLGLSERTLYRRLKELGIAE